MKKSWIYSILLLLTFLMPLNTDAQYDSIVHQMQREFETFKKGIQQEHKQFSNKNDSLFSSFLKDSWENYDAFFKSLPDNPKPSEQPIAPTEDLHHNDMQHILPQNKVKNEAERELKESEGKALINETNEYDKMGAIPVSLSFYGNSPSLILPSKMPYIKSISGEEIGLYFELTTNMLEVNHLLMQLQALKNDLLLNDWGYLKLAQATAEKIYTDPSEQILLTWIMLLKSGYNVKVGYSPEKIYLLFPSIHEIYNQWYLNVNQSTYYILTSATKGSAFPVLTVHKADYPDTSPLSLELLKIPRLGTQTMFKEMIASNDTFLIPTNENLLKFYEGYPLSELGIYFSAPVSNEILDELDKILLPLLKDLSTMQKVETLLQFTQKSFGYQTDKEQFDREKFFFPDEIFFYPSSDCEDRSILFSNLIRHYTNLDCVGLEFPNHVNTAVYIPENKDGVMISINDKSYTVCDPTYRNAPPGYLADEYRKTSPKVITIYQ